MSARVDYTRVIAAYRAAYKRLNGIDLPADFLSYDRGWFVMKELYRQRYRACQVEGFTQRLENMAWNKENAVARA